MEGATVVSEAAAVGTATGLSSVTLFFSLLIPAIVLYYVYDRIANRHFYELAEKIPGPATVPIFGNALMFYGSPHSMFKTMWNLRNQYDNIARFWILNRMAVFIADPRDIEVRFAHH